MSRTKALISILTVLILITLSAASVWAAPRGQEEPTAINGEVQGIVVEVDEATGIATVLVTLVDDSGETQVRLSLETAVALGLVQTDENGEPVLDEEGNPIPNEDMIGQPVEIDPNDVIEPEQPPAEEPTVISGEVQDIVIEVGEDGTITVVVTLVDELGETQTVRLSLETAVDLGLVQTDEDGEPVLDEEGNPIPNEDMIGQPVEIDPNDVIEEDEEGEEGWHPVASALADFFADTLGLDYDEIMGYHEDGMGFGVIAQACWMSYMMYDSEAETNMTPGDILAAKRSGDFSSITLADGETPKNWGQFRKAVLGSDKAKKNLGTIMSGRAKRNQEQEQEQEQEMTATQTQGKDKGGGKPNTPPGQDKDKGKGGGKDKGGGKGKNK